MPAHVPTPETCPVCGADVPRKARACPECGADERSGWNEDDTRYDGLDLPDDGDRAHQSAPRRVTALWPAVAAALALALILLFVFRR